MKSQSTSEEIELDQIQVQEKELVPIVPTRIHKVFSNNIPNNIKKRTFIDLTEAEARHKVTKKSNSQTKKLNPFQKLGEEANQRVIQLMKEYETKYKAIVTKTLVEEYNETVKEQFCKYLLFGVQQLNFNKPQYYQLNFRKDPILDKISNLAKSIQRVCFKNHGKNLKAYQGRCKMILQNLKDGTNKELRQKILFGIMTPETLSIAPQSQLDSSERKLAYQEKIKYLLAEADVIPSRDKIESQPEQIQNYIQPKQQIINKKSSLTAAYWQQKFTQLQKLINRIPQSFRQKFKNDLPQDLMLEFQAQLSMLLQ